jgi:hypothetical protein
MLLKSLGPLGIVAGLLWWGFGGPDRDYIVKVLEDWLPYRSMLTVMLSVIILQFCVILHLWRKKYENKADNLPIIPKNKQIVIPSNNLTPKNGVYFDQNNHAYCPICKCPITQYGHWGFDEKNYHCKPCNQFFPINPNKKDDNFFGPFSI